MANSMKLHMEKSSIPERGALQDALKNLKFRLGLDEAYSPFCSGYIPCTLDGEDAGFDIRFDEGPDGAAILLKWGGDPREKASAAMVAAALAYGFGAIVDDFVPAERLVEEARRLFSALQE